MAGEWWARVWLRSELSAKEHDLFPEGNGVALSVGVANLGFSHYGDERRLEPGNR